jgi:hypothetical protein
VTATKFNKKVTRATESTWLLVELAIAVVALAAIPGIVVLFFVAPSKLAAVGFTGVSAAIARKMVDRVALRQSG